MKTGTIIATGAIVVGAGAIGYYLWNQKKNSVSTINSNLLPSTTTQSGMSVNPQTIQNIVDQVKSYLPAKTTGSTTQSAGEYEGKLVRIAKSKVYLVIDGLLRYVPKLKEPWPPVMELSSIPGELAEGPPLSLADVQAMGLAGLNGEVSSRMLQ